MEYPQKATEYFIFLFCAIGIFSLATFSAQAQTDWGEMASGEIYEYEALDPIGGHFTSQTSGNIRCYSSGDVIHAYSDAEHTSPIESLQNYYGPNGENVRLYPAERNQTIYFYNNCPLSGGSFRFEDKKETIILADANPMPSEAALSLSTNYRLSLTFNIPVKASKCKIKVAEEEAELPISAAASTLSISWLNTLMEWYQKGAIGAEDELSVTLTGIRDEFDSSNRPDFGDGLGKLILRYRLAEKPAMLISQENTPESGCPDMMSYYLPDSREGVVRLTFDRALMQNCGATATLTYGDPDNIDTQLYTEDLPLTITDCTAEIDLRGKTRFPEEMVPGLPPQNSIFLRVGGLKSSDGQSVLTSNMASPYSYGFSYNLKQVYYSIGADWYPFPGEPLKSGDPMEIWVLNGDKISFDSIDFTYSSLGTWQTANAAYSSLTCTPDPEYPSAMIFTLNAPEMPADEETTIHVTFGNLKCADGRDHSSDIYMRYYAGSSGVDTIPTEASDDAPVFDLLGRRLSGDWSGIGIKRGKKILK